MGKDRGICFSTYWISYRNYLHFRSKGTGCQIRSRDGIHKRKNPGEEVIYFGAWLLFMLLLLIALNTYEICKLLKNKNKQEK